jgi:glycerol-3-phosphate dehydrogenase (NAD(P)+)
VEGINALPAAMRLKEKYAVEMPIVEAVNAIVNLGAAPMDTVKLLMGRDKKPELPPTALNGSYDR